MKTKILPLFVLLCSLLDSRSFAAPLAVGTVAPDFVVQTAEGRELHLSDFKGQVVVLDFWATWCHPCLESLPHTQAIAAEYKNQGVVVLAAGTSDTNARFKSWIAHNQATYPDIRFAFDSRHETGSAEFKQRISYRSYGVEGIPTKFVIGRDGRILGAVVGNLPDDARTEALLARAGVKVAATLVAKGDYQRTPAGEAESERAQRAAMSPGPLFTLAVGALKAGSAVPAFTFMDTAGHPVETANLLGAKATIFLLWSPTAAAPQAAFTLVEALDQTYRSQGVVVVGVAYGSSAAEFAQWHERFAGKLTFPVLLDPSGKAPVASKRIDDMSDAEEKAYRDAVQSHNAATFAGHLLANNRMHLAGPGIFVFDGARKFVGYTGANGARLKEAMGNLLLRAGVDLQPADRPAKVWTDEELKPKAPAAPANAIKPGDFAPDFTAQDLAGKAVRLSDYRGKVVILDFWATWCRPCQASMPHTQAVTAQYKDQGVVTLGACTSDTRAAFEKWVKKNQAKYPDILFAHDAAEREPSRVSLRLYGVNAIPKQFVIDRQGKVVATVTGYLPGEAILEAALAKAGVNVDPALVAKGAEDLKKR